MSEKDDSVPAHLYAIRVWHRVNTPEPSRVWDLADDARVVKRKRREKYLAKLDQKETEQAAEQAAERAKRAADQLERGLKQKYGLTVEQRDQMIAGQDGRCLVCGTLFGLLKANRPHVDHDHATGRVRGVLCVGCNTMLGKAADSAKLLRKAAKYLEEQR